MVCQYCNKDYKNKSDLVRHLNTCKARKKTYNIKNNVKQKVCSNEKADKLDINKLNEPEVQYSCKKCNLKFRHLDPLKRHIEGCQKDFKLGYEKQFVYKVAKKSTNTEKEMDGKLQYKPSVKRENLYLKTEPSYHKFEIDKEKSLVVISII